MSSKISDSSFENLSFQWRILWSLLFIVVIELGNIIPIPGIDYNLLAKLNQPGSNADFTQYFTTFVDIDLVDLGIFSLGIYPYINASIVFQLLVAILPDWKKLQKEEGELGRRILDQYLRYFTLGFAILQSIGVTFLVKPFLFEWNVFSATNIVLSLTAGSMVVLWISEMITRFSMTSGSSLVILFSIIGQLPTSARAIINTIIEDRSTIKIFLLLLVSFFVMSCVIIVQEGVRTIPLILVRQETQKVYLPFRLNQSGVMPLICSSAMMANFSNLANNFNYPVLKNLGIFTKSALISSLFNYLNQLSYSITYFLLILLFTYLYSTIFLDPSDVSGDLRKLTANVPNIRPGTSTINFIESVLRRVNFFGGTILGLSVLIVNSIDYFVQIPGLKYLGVSSQLIIVGVILDILKKGELALIAQKLKKESEKSDI